MGFGFGFTLKVVQGKPKQMVVDEKLTRVLGFAIMTSKKVRIMRFHRAMASSVNQPSSFNQNM